MLISKHAFKANLKHNRLRIAFIGMSNIGKSYLSERLKHENGFSCLSIDSEIAKALGMNDIDDLASWMGFPFDTHYQERAGEYLETEARLTLQVPEHPSNMVLDTTGSVVHLSGDVLQALKQRYFIIYLQATQDDIERLIVRYFEFPKPTIWADKFKPIEGKSNRESLLACYPELLASREKRYEGLADISVPATELFIRNGRTPDILQTIENYLQE